MIRKLFRKIWSLFFYNSPYVSYVFPQVKKSYMENLTITFLSKIIKIWIEILPTKYMTNFYDEFFTGKGHSSFFAKFIRAEINRQYYLSDENDIRRLNREKFWGGAAGKKWHEMRKELYKNNVVNEEFLRYRSDLLLKISELISLSFQYHTLCEIGTGNGIFLDYLSRQFQGSIKRFIGIDLNKEQISENKETYKDTKLEFIHGEITEWVNNQCEKGIIFIASGVFEYFTQSELEELFLLIQKKVSPAMIALCEPVNFDLAKEMNSKPRGNTMFSHNYPHLFNQFNYHVFYQKVEHIDPNIKFYDCVIMGATTYSVN